MTPLNKEAMMELASRVESADGADRGLDRLVQIAVTGVRQPMLKPEPYPASLDAAMTLVPEGWQVWALKQDDTGWWAGLSRDGGETVKGGWGPTPTAALALTAACLRALSSQVKS